MDKEQLYKKNEEDHKILGYCACCGTPHYESVTHLHYSDCIWSDENDHLGHS